MPKISPRRYATLRIALRALVGFGLLALAIRMNRDQLRDVFSRSLDGRLFAIAFALYMAGMLVAYTRWYFLVRAVGLPFRLIDAVRLGMIGTLFNFVIPGAIGGDFVRAAFLCREQQRRAQPIASVFVDRIVGVLGLFLLACASGTAAWPRLDGPVRRLVTIAWIAAAISLLPLVLAFLPGIGRSEPRRPSRRKGRSRFKAELVAVGQSYRKHFAVVPLGVVMGMMTHSLNVLAFHLVNRALFPVVPGLAEDFLIVPLVLFTTAVPLPFGALGVSEHISGNLFRLAHSPNGAVAMMGFRVLQLGAALLGGLVYLGNKSQVRELTQAASHLDDELIREEAAAEPPPVTSLEGSSDR